MTSNEEIRIQEILTRYWNCQTTLAEEQELRDFFSGSRVPASMQHYVPLFSYINDEQSVTLSATFDKRLQAAMDQMSGATKKNITIPFHSVAAHCRIAVLIIGLGISIFITPRTTIPGLLNV